jgi:hypothetical protein
MKIVNESYNSTLIFMNVAFDKLHINGTQMTLMLLICVDFYLWQSAWSVLSAFYALRFVDVCDVFVEDVFADDWEFHE